MSVFVLYIEGTLSVRLYCLASKTMEYLLMVREFPMKELGIYRDSILLRVELGDMGTIG